MFFEIEVDHEVEFEIEFEFCSLFKDVRELHNMIDVKETLRKEIASVSNDTRQQNAAFKGVVDAALQQAVDDVDKVKADVATDLDKVKADVTTGLNKVNADVTADLGKVKADVAADLGKVNVSSIHYLVQLTCCLVTLLF